MEELDVSFPIIQYSKLRVIQLIPSVCLNPPSTSSAERERKKKQTVNLYVKLAALSKSPFDPTSTILPKTLIIMSVMFVVFSIFGYLWSFYLKKLKNLALNSRHSRFVCTTLPPELSRSCGEHCQLKSLSHRGLKGILENSYIFKVWYSKYPSMSHRKTGYRKYNSDELLYL